MSDTDEAWDAGLSAGYSRHDHDVDHPYHWHAGYTAGLLAAMAEGQDVEALDDLITGRHDRSPEFAAALQMAVDATVDMENIVRWTDPDVDTIARGIEVSGRASNGTGVAAGMAVALGASFADAFRLISALVAAARVDQHDPA